MSDTTNFCRFSVTEAQRDALVAVCNDELKSITDLSSPQFELWFELRKKLSAAPALAPVARRPRKTKADAAANGIASVAAPALATSAA